MGAEEVFMILQGLHKNFYKTPPWHQFENCNSGNTFGLLHLVKLWGPLCYFCRQNNEVDT